MAPTSSTFVLVLVLFVTRMGLPVDGDNINVEAPMYPAPPMDSSSPVYPPMAVVDSSPVYPPMVVDAPPPFWSPTSPLPTGYGKACVAMCFVHCNPIHPRRRCMRTCTACCSKWRCVPEFSECCYWDTVTIRGYEIQCP